LATPPVRPSTSLRTGSERVRMGHPGHPSFADWISAIICTTPPPPYLKLHVLENKRLNCYVIEGIRLACILLKTGDLCGSFFRGGFNPAKAKARRLPGLLTRWTASILAGGCEVGPFVCGWNERGWKVLLDSVADDSSSN